MGNCKLIVYCFSILLAQTICIWATIHAEEQASVSSEAIPKQNVVAERGSVGTEGTCLLQKQASRFQTVKLYSEDEKMFEAESVPTSPPCIPFCAQPPNGTTQVVPAVSAVPAIPATGGVTVIYNVA